MNISIHKQFNKDADKINDKKLLKKLHNVIQSIKKANRLNEINNITKLTDYEDYYRIKISNYRIGLKYKNNHVSLIRFKPRKDIYKSFP